MSMRPDKKQIHSRFTRAAATYDRQAGIQRRVAERLLTLLDRNCPRPPKRVLEIGCSTGILTAMLALRYKDLEILYVNDLVPEFNAMVREKVGNDLDLVFLPGDIESMDLPSNLDLVISSSTFHWLHNLHELLDRLHDRMTFEGILCFAMYGPDNLHELREITGIGLDYFSVADLEKMLGNRFKVLACEEELFTFHFADPKTLLDHLRQTGVNALDPTPWTRSRLNDFIRLYAQRFGGPDGVILTYHPVYCVAAREMT
jgi:malonyl-CoA O-methyltransferase